MIISKVYPKCVECYEYFKTDQLYKEFPGSQILFNQTLPDMLEIEMVHNIFPEFQMKMMKMGMGIEIVQIDVN